MNDPETTTYWLEKDERTFAFAVKDLIDRMHTQAGKDDPARALAHLESLQSKMNLGERFEQARAHLECALAANTVHNPWMAVYELKQSLDLLGTGRQAARITSKPLRWPGGCWGISTCLSGIR